MAVTKATISSLFEITGNETPEWLLTDETDYSQFGLINSEVKVNFELISPQGLIHNNTDYDTPDINRGTTDEYTNDLPADVNYYPFNGIYSQKPNVQVTKEILAVSTADDYFEIAGDRTEDLATTTTITISGSTGNDGMYTIASTQFIGGNTRITVTTTVPSSVADGDLSYVVEGDAVAFEYAFCAPILDISMVSDCDTSTLIAKDITDYAITYTGQYTSLAPQALTRLHTVSYPQGITPYPAALTSTGAQINVYPIWTKTWTDVFTSTATWLLPSGVYISWTGKGSQEHTVSCNNDQCEVSGCVTNVYASWKRALSDGSGRNSMNAEQWGEIVQQITANYMIYLMARSCAEPEKRQLAFNEIKRLAAECGCGCDCVQISDKLPQQVVPVTTPIITPDDLNLSTVVVDAGSGVTITVSIVGNTTTYTVALNYAAIVTNTKATGAETITGTIDTKLMTPAGFMAWQQSLGNNKVVTTNGSGVVIGTTQGTAFNKDFGVDVGDIPEIGATLAPSSAVGTDANGKIITTGASSGKYTLLYSSAAATLSSAGTSPQLLRSFVLPANSLVNDGDKVLIQCYYKLDYQPNYPTIYPQFSLQFSGVGIGVGSGGTASGYEDLQLNLEITKRANDAYSATNTQLIRKVMIGTTPPELQEYTPQYETINHAADQTIGVYSTTLGSGAAGYITLVQFSVALIKV